MFDIQINDSAVQLHLTAMPQKLQQRLLVALTTLSEKLRNYIVGSKLSGEVLNRNSGDLARSIQYKVDSSETEVTGTVFSSGYASIYGKIHEYGAVFSRRVEMAWGKPMKNPHDVIFHYPERSFMRTGLADQRPEIVSELQQAVKEGTT